MIRLEAIAHSGERTRSRVLVSAPRRKNRSRSFPRRRRDGGGAIAGTRGACAPQT